MSQQYPEQSPKPQHAPGTPDTPGTPPPADPVRQRKTPRSGPIVWGTLILVYCAYLAQRLMLPGTVDDTGWIALVVAGIGVLLLGVGIATVLRGRRSQ